MSKYKVVLLRHSESVWNSQNKFTGWVDVELSDKGKIQAKQAGALLEESGFSFDLVFTSVLKRATQTKEIVLLEMGLENIACEQSVALNERNYGDLQGVNKKEAVERFGQEKVLAWRRGYTEKPPGQAAESLKDVFDRVVALWQEKIAPAIKQGKNVLIVAHGNSLRALVKFLDNLSDKEVENLNIPVAVPLVYELNENWQAIKHYYLGNQEEIAKAIEAVATETKLWTGSDPVPN